MWEWSSLVNVSHTYRHPRGESDKRKLELVISRRSLGDHPHLCAHTPLYVPDVGQKEQRPEDNHLSSRVIYQLVVPFCGSWPFVMCFGQKERKIRTTGQLRRLPIRQRRIGSRYHPHTHPCSLSPDCYRNLHYALASNL